MLRAHALAEQTYERHLPSLRQWAGWFVLIRGDRLGGVFRTYEAAATAWMSMYGPVPALIRRIDVAGQSVVTTASPAAPAGHTPPLKTADAPPIQAARPMDVVFNWGFPNGRTAPEKRYAA